MRVVDQRFPHRLHLCLKVRDDIVPDTDAVVQIAHKTIFYCPRLDRHAVIARDCCVRIRLNLVRLRKVWCAFMMMMRVVRRVLRRSSLGDLNDASQHFHV